MKVLLIGYGFPPIETPGSIRMMRLVERLDDSRFHIRVLTTGQSITTRQGQSSLSSIPEKHIIRVNDPLAFKTAHAIGGITPARPGGSRSQSWLVSAGRFVLFPDRAMPWALRARSAVGSLAGFTPDIVLSSSPFLSTHFVGHAFARRARAKWIAEFRDPFSWLPQQDETGPLRRKLLARLERWAVENADVTVTISDAFSDYFRAIYPQATIRSVPNGIDFQPDVIETKLAQRRKRLEAKAAGDPLILVHAGSLYGGARDPSPLIVAAKKASQQIERPIRLRFIGGDSHLAVAAAEKCGARELVEAVGSLDHASTVEETERADALIALLHRDAVARIGIMSKFFDYAATGNPVLIVGERRAMLSQIVENEGAGAAREYHDVDGMTDWMANLARNPAEPNYDAVALSRNWSADRMAERMAEIFDEVAAR